MNILLLDTETSLLMVRTFALFEDVTSHESIERDWHIICACWKWLGERKVHSVSVLDDPHYTDPNEYISEEEVDKWVCIVLRDVVAKADVIVAHNGDKFDIRKLNARLIYHGLDPLPPIATVDTLKEARKIARFTSNRLDYLGKYLGYGGKLHTPKGLWPLATDGNEQAIKTMVKYCKQDVKLLEHVYMRLRPYMRSHPNANIFNGTTHSCPSCGSTDLQHRGFLYARLAKKQRYQCNTCGSWSSSGVNEVKQVSEVVR